ncbi:protein NipSnap homolog 2-like [Saccoglossus kowalevskii]|uniref:Protein NipSnap homolog 2-like n=1 Tax=Saccoglossus kowalevskii TaxID=10224 RepID=A0ABM0GY30_SACKO|nr:PREDICTED: protein NipSnap homolog 2-like [Saccoglossus kowalevskii]
MAAIIRRFPVHLRSNARLLAPLVCRNFNTSESDGAGQSMLSKLFVKQVEPATAAHSRLLATKEYVYELQIHDVKPDCFEDYKAAAEQHLKNRHEDGNIPSKLFGSWITTFGHQDQAVHIWLYENGYKDIMQTRAMLLEDPEYVKYKKERLKMLVSRRNQLLQAFSFWGEPDPREPGNIYEMRSYHLKPGTMIEWGNNWRRGIECRRAKNENIAGLFTQIGDLYLVHHIFAYENLQTRKEVRENAWQKPGWDQTVAYTVPLIRKMESRIMRPFAHSPLK